LFKAEMVPQVPEDITAKRVTRANKARRALPAIQYCATRKPLPRILSKRSQEVPFS